VGFLPKARKFSAAPGQNRSSQGLKVYDTQRDLARPSPRNSREGGTRGRPADPLNAEKRNDRKRNKVLSSKNEVEKDSSFLLEPEPRAQYFTTLCFEEGGGGFNKRMLRSQTSAVEMGPQEGRSSHKKRRKLRTS